MNVFHKQLLQPNALGRRSPQNPTGGRDKMVHNT